MFIYKNSIINALKYLFLIIIFSLVILPAVAVLISSLFDTFNFYSKEASFITLKWYAKLFSDQKLLKGWINSVTIGIISSVVSTITALYLGLRWKYNKNRTSIAFLMILLAVVPPDVHSLGIKYIFKYLLGYKTSSIIAVLFSHFTAILPYCWLLIVAVLYQIRSQIIDSCYDLGGTKIFCIRKIIFPLIRPAIISSLALGFLISFNEYGRAYYLSGPVTMISEIIFGEMASGTDPSINALSGFNIIMTYLVIIFVVLSYALIKKKLAD